MAQFKAEAGVEYINPTTGRVVKYSQEQLNDPAQGQLSDQFKPNIIKDSTNDLVSGSSGIRSQADELQKLLLNNVSGTSTTANATPPATEPISTITPQEQQLIDANKAVSAPMSTEEEDKIKRAGEAAALLYNQEIAKANKEKGKGLGISEVSAGEAGGFMSTQFVGASAEPGFGAERAMVAGRYGTGGELARIKSEYDTVISNLEAQKQNAIASAEAEARTAIRTGRQQSFDNAYKLFQAAQDVAKQKIDVANSLSDRLMKINNYNLEVKKLNYQQYNDEIKNNLDSSKLDVDIANVTGKWIDGSMTLAAKKQMVEEQYKEMGHKLDVEKFNWQMSADELKQDLENKKYLLDAQKYEDEKSGFDANIAADAILNGTLSPDSVDGKKATTQRVLSTKKQLLRDAGKETNNPYYNIKASAGGKNVVSSDQQLLGKIWTVMGQLDQVKAAFDEATAKGKTGAFGGRITDLKFWDQDKAKIDAALAGVVPTVARGIFGEVGVLTDNDINNYKKAIASVKTPNEARDVIFNMLITNVASKATETLRSNANAKYDVSGYANDYEMMMDNINKKLGGEKLKKSTNPAVYDSLSEFLSSVDPMVANQFQQTATLEMKKSGISDINDYFEGLKEAAINKGILKDLPISSSGGGITSDFNNVGADTNKGVGNLSKKYESGGNPGAIGYDKTGGYSYGIYQMAHNTAQNFINQSKYSNEFKGLTFNSPEWQNKWKEIAKKDTNGFSNAQELYINDKYLIPQLNKVANSGLDVNKFSPILQEVIFSTAIQHGANTDIVVKAYNDARKKLGREPNDTELITQIYNERWSGGERFASSTPEVKESVKKRLIAERTDALKQIS